MVKYISKEGEKHIAQFTYKGKDLSITYEYIWSPLAEKMLQLTPVNLAPNTITIVGFLFNIVGTIILCLQLPFGQSAPTWSLVLYGLSVFIYQMLDNVDGKQARKIKNGTPLGMIMDHGCDALGVVALTAGMGRVVCIDQPVLFVWTYVLVVISFYMSAWVQYHSNGIMILGKFNAVDEGIPIIWICAFITAILGQEFWRMQVELLGHVVLANRLVVYGIFASGLIQIYSVVAQSGQEFTKDLAKAFKDLIHTALVFGTICLIMIKSDLAKDYVVELILGLAFTMSRTISYTLVCSVSKMKFQQFQPSLIVFTLGYSVYVLFLQNIVRAEYVVYGIMIFAIAEYFLFVVSVSNHIADILRIRIFKVFTPKQSKSQ